MRLRAKAGDSGEHVIMLENVTASLWNAIFPPTHTPPPPPFPFPFFSLSPRSESAALKS